MFRKGPAKNTVNMAGDGDDVDMLRDVERAFGIELASAEVESIYTVGDLYDLVCSRIDCSRIDVEPSPTCLSARAFRGLRDASFAEPRPVRPSTPIADLRWEFSEHDWCRTMSKRTGLDLEIGEWYAPFAWGFMALFFVPVIIFVVWSGEWGIWTLLAFLLWLLLPLFRYAPTRLSPGVVTVADLIRRSMGRNYARLRAAAGSGNRSDVWLTVCGIVRDNTGHDGPIDRDTTFFAKFAR